MRVFFGNRLKPLDPMPPTDWIEHPTITPVSDQKKQSHFNFWIPMLKMIDLNVNGTTVFGRCLIHMLNGRAMIWLFLGWWLTCSMPVFRDNSLSSRILSSVLILRMAFLYSKIYLWLIFKRGVCPEYVYRDDYDTWSSANHVEEIWGDNDKQPRMTQSARLLVPSQRTYAKALGHHEWEPTKQSSVSLKSSRSNT